MYNSFKHSEALGNKFKLMAALFTAKPGPFADYFLAPNKLGIPTDEKWVLYYNIGNGH